MTNEEDAFLNAIAASPGDKLPRLVFADWLEEQSDERHVWVRDDDLWVWMGPRAQSPIPSLLEALYNAFPATPQDDPGTLDCDPERVLELLIRAGPSAVAPLLERLDRPEPWPEMVWTVAGNFPYPLYDAVPQLTRLAASRTAAVARTATRLLVRAAEIDAALLDPILAAVWRIGDPNTERALDALGFARERVADYVAIAWRDRLSAELGRPNLDDPEFVLARLHRLADAAEPSPEAMPMFRLALAHPHAEFAFVAAQGLSRLAEKSAPHVLDAVLTCKEANRDAVYLVARAAWPDWEDRLLDLADGGKLPLASRIGFVHCLGHASPEKWPRVSGQLKAALRHKDPALRKAAVQALGLSKAPSISTIPMLRDAMGDPDPEFRIEVLKAYFAQERPQSILVAALKTGLVDHSPEVVSASLEVAGFTGLTHVVIEDAFRTAPEAAPEDLARAATLLGRFCESDERVLPRLLEWIGDREVLVRRAASRAIADALQPNAKGVYRPLRKALRDPDALVRQNAAMAFGKLGPRAKEEVPELLELSRDTVPIARAGALYALARIDLEDADILKAVYRGLRDDNERVVQSTLQGLEEASYLDGATLLKRIMDLSEHPVAAIRKLVFTLISRIDEEGFEDECFTLSRRALKDADPDVAHEAFLSVMCDDKNLPKALDDIFALYRSQNDEAMRHDIEHYLKENPTIVSRIARLLGDADDEVRRRGLWWLRSRCESNPDQRGPIATAALPYLPKLLTSERGERMVAALTLTGYLGAAAAPCLPMVQTLLEHPNRGIRTAAQKTVGALGEAALPVAPTLLKILQISGDPSERGSVAAALVSLSVHDAALLPPAMERFHGDDLAVRITIAERCGRHPELGQPIVPELVREMAIATDGALLIAIAKALGNHGRAVRGSIPPICEILERMEEDESLDEFILALGKLGPNATGSMPTLIRLRGRDYDEDVHAHILESMAKIPGEGRATAVARSLTDESEHVRGIASLVLEELGDEAVEAIPIVCRALLNLKSDDIITRSIRETDDEVTAGDDWHDVFDLECDFRESILGILEKLGRKAAPAIPTLERLLDDEYEVVREAAAKVLAAIGPKAKAALREAARHRDEAVREIAREALDEMA